MSRVANCPHGLFVGHFVVIKQFDGAVPRPGGQNVLLGVKLQTGHLFVVVVQGSNGDPQTRSTTTLFEIFSDIYTFSFVGTSSTIDIFSKLQNFQKYFRN